MESESVKFSFEMVGTGVAGAIVGAVTTWFAGHKNGSDVSARLAALEARMKGVESNTNRLLDIVTGKKQ